MEQIEKLVLNYSKFLNGKTSVAQDVNVKNIRLI